MTIKNLQPATYKNDGVGEVLTRTAVELELGVPVPDVLFDVLVEYQGPVAFKVLVGIGPVCIPGLVKNQMLGVELLYGLNSGDHGLIKMRETYFGRVAAEFLPIADAGAGDQIFFSSVTGKVYFWHHECAHGEASNEAMTLISNSVQDFLENLERAQEPEYEPSGIIEKPGQFEQLRELVSEQRKEGGDVDWGEYFRRKNENRGNGK